MAEKQLKDNRGARALRRVKLSQDQIAMALTDVRSEERPHQSTVCRWCSAELKPGFKWRLRMKRKFGIGMGWWDVGLDVSDREVGTASL